MRSIYIVIAVCFIVYFNALFGGLVSDDNLIIPRENNRQVIFYNMGAFITSVISDWIGTNTISHHLVNVIFHALMCVLLFYFLRIFFPEIPSLMGALLFAVLPIHTENVTWVCGLNHLLEGVCFLAVFLLFYKRRYAWSLLLFTIFALSVSPWIGLIPAFILAFIIMFPEGRAKQGAGWLVASSGILFISFMANALLVKNRMFHVSQQMGLGESLNLIDPFPRMIYSLKGYLSLSLFPSKLSLYHLEPSISFLSYEPLWIGGIVLCVILAVLLFVLFKQKKNPWLVKDWKVVMLGALTFLIFTLPSYSPIPICGMVVERYAYIPTVGFSIILAFIVSKLGKKIIPVCLIILALYAVRTIDRNADYRTEERFWRTTLAVSSFSPQAWNNIGVVYAQENNVLKALQSFHNSLLLKPDYKEARENFDLVAQAIKQNVKVKY